MKIKTSCRACPIYLKHIKKLTADRNRWRDKYSKIDRKNRCAALEHAMKI